LTVFALNGVALKFAAMRTLFARSSATLGWAQAVNINASLSLRRMNRT